MKTVMKILLFVCIFSLLGNMLCAAAESAPVCAYTFEGDFTSWVSDSFPIAPYGSMAFVQQGASGKGIKLIDGYLEIKNSGHIAFSDAFSFATWFKVLDVSHPAPMLLARESLSGDVANGPVSVALSDDYTFFKTGLSFQMEDGSVESYNFSSAPAFFAEDVKDVWHHMAVVFDRSAIYYYLDGKLLSAEVLPDRLRGYVSIANSYKTMTIGRGAAGSFAGILDGTRVYDTAITAATVSNLYTQAEIGGVKTTLVLTEGSDVMSVNGMQVQMAAPVKRDSASDRIVVPLRSIVEAFGGEIAWDGTDQLGRVDIALGEVGISLWMLDTNALVSGAYRKLDVYPYVENGVTYVPVRFVSEQLGASVDWDEETKEITITF